MKSTALKRFAMMASAAAIASSSVFTGVAFAAGHDGTLGANSSGAVFINVTKVKEAQITSLADWAIGNWGVATGAVNQTTDVCVYSSSSGGAYTIVATGDGGAGSNAFVINDGVATHTAAHDIPYAVSWDDTSPTLGASGTTLVSAASPASFSNADTADVTCTTRKTARLFINITAADLQAAVPGTFSGTLTLLIAPV